MKRFATTLVMFVQLIMFGCEPPVPEEDTQLEHQAEMTIHQIPEGDLEILEIDGCEYIIFKDARGSNHGFGYMAHKGNCKNPIHCYNSGNGTNTLEKGR